MSVNSLNSVTTNTANYDNYDVASKKPTEKEESVVASTVASNQQTENTQTAAVYEKSSSTTTSTSKTSSKVDSKTITSMLNESNQKVESFKKLVSSLLTKQSTKSSIAGKNGSANGTALSGISMPSSNLKSFFSNLEVDSATVAQAKADISEDGYYGVKQTSGRLLDFAKAIAGNDPDKLEEMRKAVQKGFEQAERMWGGQLPEISQQTYDATMKGFDDWKASITSSISATE